METGSVTNSAALLSHTLSLDHLSWVLCFSFCTFVFSVSHLPFPTTTFGQMALIPLSQRTWRLSAVRIFSFSMLLYMLLLWLHPLSPRFRGEVPNSHPGQSLCWSFCDVFLSLWDVIVAFPLIYSSTCTLCHSLHSLHA